MPRYIDAEKIRYRTLTGLGSLQSFVGVTEEDIRRIPTADVAPVVHAHWIPLYGRMYACNDKIGEIVQTGYKCSACGREEEDRWQICRCGARMDEEVRKDG